MTTQTYLARRFNRPSTLRSGLMALALFAFWICSNFLQAQVYNPRHYDLDKIVQAFKSPHDDLTILISHRGLHALADGSTPGVPENSIESIRQAAMAGLEAVEVDVKLTRDGTPILSHDYTWGRETCITYQTISDGVPFNPFIAKGNAYNDSRNPKVSDLDLSRLRWWYFDNTTLRDGISIVNPPALTNQGCSTTGHGYTGEYPPTLQDVLNYMKDHSIAMVLTLDIKDPATAKQAWAIVLNTTDYRGVSFAKSTLFKVPARNFTTPASFYNVFGGTAYPPALFPYYGTADIQPIKQNGSNSSNFGSEGAMMSALLDMESAYPGWIVATEVDLKEDGGGHILSNLYNYAKFDYANNVAMRVGNFSPFKDLDKPGDPQPALPKFFSNTGYCCDTLLDYRYNVPNTVGVDSDDPYVEVLAYDPNRPSDVQDQRGDHSWITGKGFDIITADDVKTWNTELASSKRNVCGWLSSDVTACLNFQPTDVAPLSNPPRTTPETVPDTPGLSGSGTFSGSGEPTGNIPALSSSNSATFTIQGGGSTFTVSQPNDSVATYTWTDGGSLSEVVTSANGAGLGYALSFVQPGSYSGAQPSATITVDTGTTYQTIDGFGGAMTDSAASLILGSSYKSQMMQTLFGTGAGGAGLTMVRSPMGSSDMMASATDIHTYEDTVGSFSANAYASDQRQISALQQAKAIVGNNFKILGTPWTAPAWMKRGGSLLPAQCGTDQNEIDSTKVSQYASYFIAYYNAYSSLGLAPWAVSLQNEPENCKTAMPTTLMSATDEVALAASIRSGIAINTLKILGWDHNWNDPDFVNTLVASGKVDAIGYHCYDGTHYSNQTTAVPTYMTECSGFTTSSANVAQNLGWEVANLLIGPLRYGSRGAIYWSIAQDPNGNPHLGGSDACQTCRGMVSVNSDGSFQPTQDLFYWSHFSKFVPPGSVRTASNNSGNLSTVSFRNGNQNTLVVLNSASSHADGGAPGSDERNLSGHIVQWDGDTATQKTAWLVGSDGYRRWVSDGGTYNCLKYDAGMQGPDVEAAGALDKYINHLDVWAVCGQGTMGTDSELEVGTYLKSGNGARLTLTAGGLTAVDADGRPNWTPGGGGANRLILQKDGNLVAYQGTDVKWASNTMGSGAIWLSIHDDASFTLYNKANAAVWSSPINASWYIGKIVEWEGDTATQKTSWLVGADGKRRWIPDLATFNCLHDAGAGNAIAVTSDVLDLLPNLDNVWATCGGSQIGVNGAIERGGKLSAGNNTLTLQSDGNLVLYHTDNGSETPSALWASNTNSGVQLRLQTDGNLVLYDAAGSSVWASGTDGSNPGYLILGTDASLRLWDASGNNVWSRDPSEVPKYAQAGYNFCAKEGSSCNFIGTGRVFFGAPNAAGSTWKDGVVNSIACTVTAFGNDPAHGIVKDCWYRTPY